MNCPTCIKEMKKFRYFQVEIDRCQYCGGLWLDGNELRLFIEKGLIPRQLLTDYCTDVRNAKVDEGERECPRCETSKLKIINHKGINVDYCSECGGFWFDRGELLKILDRYFNELADEGENAAGVSVRREIDKSGKEIIRIIDEGFSGEGNETSGEWENRGDPLTKEFMSAGSKLALLESVPKGILKLETKSLKVRVKEELSRDAEQRREHIREGKPANAEAEKQNLVKPLESEEDRESVMGIIIRFLRGFFTVITGSEENKNRNQQ